MLKIISSIKSLISSSLLFSRLIFWFFLASCSSETLPDSNEIFNQRYGKEIEKIKKSRQISEKKIELNPNSPRINFTAPVNEDRSTYSNKNVRDSREIYSSIQFQNQVANNKNFATEIEMFENNYSSAIQFPLRSFGKEFDVIDIPAYDAYGVETEMTSKDYLYISKKLLQKNIDEINQNKDSDHIKNSQTLISEQNENARIEKMKRNFGDDYQKFIESDNAKKKKIIAKKDDQKDVKKDNQKNENKDDKKSQPEQIKKDSEIKTSEVKNPPAETLEIDKK